MSFSCEYSKLLLFLYSRLELTLCKRGPLSVSENYKNTVLFKENRDLKLHLYLQNGLLN